MHDVISPLVRYNLRKYSNSVLGALQKAQESRKDAEKMIIRNFPSLFTFVPFHDSLLAPAISSHQNGPSFYYLEKWNCVCGALLAQ